MNKKGMEVKELAKIILTLLVLALLILIIYNILKIIP